MENNNVRNIAIIAHVDHGKTSLVNELLKQGWKVVSCAPMESSALVILEK